MLLALLALVAGLVFLVWSADYFVDGAAATAQRLGIPQLLIGMLVVGFGTSAPEMLVSALSALQGNPGLALGNAYGSNIANIALILGVTATLRPIMVHRQVVQKELPLLMGATLFAVFQLLNGTISRLDGILLLLLFGLIMGWSTWKALQNPAEDTLLPGHEEEVQEAPLPLPKALQKLAVGLVVLTASSKALVWGAVIIARVMGISDLVIGLTIVAIGTSLPELASSVAAIRKGASDIALGNVLGSNLFNTLMVVGIAGTIHPMKVPAEALHRDCLIMGGLTLILFLFCRQALKGKGRISRMEGLFFLASYGGYLAWLLFSALS